jgi:hypothetical protein
MNRFGRKRVRHDDVWCGQFVNDVQASRRPDLGEPVRDGLLSSMLIVTASSTIL